MNSCIKGYEILQHKLHGIFFVFLESNGLYKIDGTEVDHFNYVIIRKSKTLVSTSSKERK